MFYWYPLHHIRCKLLFTTHILLFNPFTVADAGIFEKDSSLALPVLDIVLMVVGAGRGPLVRAAIEAAKSVGMTCRVLTPPLFSC